MHDFNFFQPLLLLNNKKHGISINPFLLYIPHWCFHWQWGFCVLRNTQLFDMIKTIKHKGLLLFFETGKTSGIQYHHTEKLQMQLAALNTATVIDDMNLPGYRLHKLKGDRKTTWSVRVDKNWRLTFEFDEGDIYLLNYEDYH